MPRNRYKLICLLTSTLLLASCGSETPDSDEGEILRPVRTWEVVRAEEMNKHEFTAVVDASRKANLSFKVSGEIVEVFIDQGDEVRRNQALAKLDDKDIKVQLGEARSLFEKARGDFERAKSLIQSNTISRSDYDQVKANFNSASAAFDTVKNNLSYTELRAPFAGVIARQMIENFEEVNAKEPVFILYDLSRIDLK
ncbi:MAG: efflux RND transporter periplasmic adaptor subunit, partial [Pseudomonadota bacterium]